MPLFGKIGLPQDQLDQFAQYVQAQIPVGRFGRSAEVARAVTFLASDDSSSILGTELVADGV
jgi:NAD(P)-dependent dehydrogenase (short-subunit alcohol dehydrogenase family)